MAIAKPHPIQEMKTSDEFAKSDAKMEAGE
jgi:hypothetical protein